MPRTITVTLTDAEYDFLAEALSNHAEFLIEYGDADESTNVEFLAGTIETKLIEGSVTT